MTKADESPFSFLPDVLSRQDACLFYSNSTVLQLYVVFLFLLRAFRHLLGKFFPLFLLLLFLLFHLLASLLAEFGVGDTGVVDRLQAPDEHVLGRLQVAEGDGAVVEEALAHL